MQKCIDISVLLFATHKYSFGYFTLLYATRKSHRHLLHSVMSHNVPFAFSKNVKYLDKEQRYKNSTKKNIGQFKRFLKYNQENTGQNFVS